MSLLLDGRLIRFGNFFISAYENAIKKPTDDTKRKRSFINVPMGKIRLETINKGIRYNIIDNANTFFFLKVAMA